MIPRILQRLVRSGRRAEPARATPVVGRVGRRGASNLGTFDAHDGVSQCTNYGATASRQLVLLPDRLAAELRGLGRACRFGEIQGLRDRVVRVEKR